MPAKKLDHIVICDTADLELAETLGDWLDTNLKTVSIRHYDSTEHLQFPVQTAQAFKTAKSVVICLTDNFTPLKFPLRSFNHASRMTQIAPKARFLRLPCAR